jgi:hypothetical protein
MGVTCSTNGKKMDAYGLLVGKPEGSDYYEDQDVCRWMFLSWVLERYDEVVWTGLVCLRIGTSGRPLPFGFNKMPGISRVAAQLVVSLVVLSSVELVSHLVS